MGWSAMQYYVPSSARTIPIPTLAFGKTRLTLDVKRLVSSFHSLPLTYLILESSLIHLDLLNCPTNKDGQPY